MAFDRVPSCSQRAAHHIFMKITSTLWIALCLAYLAGAGETRAGEDRQVRPRVMPPPIYPKELKKRGIKGSVVVEFIVDTTGVVVATRVIQSTNPAFDEPARAAISRWRFDPGLKDGKPVNVRVQQELSFSVPVHEPVYPFAQLLEGRDGTVTLEFSVDENEQLKRAEVRQATDPAFAKAALANLDDEYATSPPLKTFVSVPGGWRVAPYDFKANGRGTITVSESTRQILKLLRKPNSSFFIEADLDQRLVAVENDPPVFPLALRETHTTGVAVVEFFVDRAGVPQLPRVVEASHEDFGYAAVQAVAGWRFEPPMKNGKPVMVRAQVPVEFKYQPVEITITPP